MLEEASTRLSATEELQWANRFIAEEYLSAFERSREFFLKIFPGLSVEERLSYLTEVWEENHKKGYVTEMETTAMFTLAKDWGIEKEFLEIIKR